MSSIHGVIVNRGPDVKYCKYIIAIGYHTGGGMLTRKGGSLAVDRVLFNTRFYIACFY